MLPPLTTKRTIEHVAREEWGRILASLVKTLGDLELAEDCLQDAVVSAMKHWTKNGLPRSPAAWLITVARRKAIDKLRNHKNFLAKQNEISYLLDLENRSDFESEIAVIPDKQLELIFTCCHPILAEKTRVALTLRTLGGLSTEQIAAAFLDNPDAMQQRLTRAKRKIASSNIPFEVPDNVELPRRISSVLRVIYLVFNEGYSVSNGEILVRNDLSDEAIRLARIVCTLMPDETEVAGLLALMLLHDSRRISRVGKDGELIPLEKQQRSRWNQSKISEGVSILEKILPKQRIGTYQLQAAISAVHAQSRSWEETDWHEITALYEMLYKVQPSPVIRVNQAVSISYSSSISDALAMLDDLEGEGELDRYQPYFAAKGDLLARSGHLADARKCFETAIKLSDNLQEKKFLIARTASL